MEVFLLYLDDLDDLYGMVGLVAERLRRMFLSLLSLTAMLAAAFAGGWLALAHPFIALAVGYLLSVVLLYRLVTMPMAPRSA